MADEEKTTLYRLRIGKKVYVNITVPIIIKNIRNGKLNRDNEIAAAGSDTWIPLGNVPELASYFRSAPKKTPAENNPPPEQYDLLRENRIIPAISLQTLKVMIRKGELNEVDQIRQCPDGDWTLAGDVNTFHPTFDLRRAQIAEKGYSAIEKDIGIPFYLDFIAPFAYIANSRFLLNLAAVLMVYAIAVFIRIPIVYGPLTILTNLYIYSYYFRVINDASAGNKKFPEFADVSDFRGELVSPAVKFFLSRLFSILPLLFYISFVKLRQFSIFDQFPILLAIMVVPWLVLVIPFPRDVSQVLGEMMKNMGSQGSLSQNVDPNMFSIQHVASSTVEYLTLDPFVWICLLFFLFYFPIALMRQAAYGESLPTFNFPAVFTSIKRALIPFVALIGFMIAIDAVSAIFYVALSHLLGMTMAGPGAGMMSTPAAPVATFIPAVFQLLNFIIDIVGKFLKMYLIGRFLFQNTERMGWA